jgi:hypothetical protein
MEVAIGAGVDDAESIGGEVCQIHFVYGKQLNGQNSFEAVIWTVEVSVVGREYQCSPWLQALDPYALLVYEEAEVTCEVEYYVPS